MMKRPLQYRFVDSHINPEGLSMVWLYRNHRLYYGEAKLNPEDKEYQSRFLGCEIAEIRAYIKMLKDEIEKERLYYKHVLTFLDHTGMVDNPKLQKNAYKIKKRIDDLKEEIETQKSYITKKVDNYFTYHKNKEHK